ncbi:MAG TPA: HDOD domain-containing protein [Steroidobacteraceae bacterium]|nr:HDOD domain-containing protein [Steroidobacteraceae bacterium]
MIWWYVLAVSFTAVAGAFLYWRFAQREVVVGAGFSGVKVDTSKVVATDDGYRATIPFSNDAIVEAQKEVYKLAFNVARVDYKILGDHLKVLQVAEEAAISASTQPKYFPRKPSLLPKLLRAINTGDGGRKDIVRLILQDPVLSGNVLRRANSVFYRASGSDPVESVDRAVSILGNEGLREPVATAVMQPVFQLPRGFFEQFAPLTWELAQRTALAAETHARVTNSADAFVAHLLGMLSGLGRIVLFRVTLDVYRKYSNIMPRPEVFVRTMIAHELQVTRAIAAAWEMSPAFLQAINEQLQKISPERMTPLSRTLYYANLCGTFATLERRNQLTFEIISSLLCAQGLNAEAIAPIWNAATSDIS